MKLENNKTLKLTVIWLLFNILISNVWLAGPLSTLLGRTGPETLCLLFYISWALTVINVSLLVAAVRQIRKIPKGGRTVVALLVVGMILNECNKLYLHAICGL